MIHLHPLSIWADVFCAVFAEIRTKRLENDKMSATGVDKKDCRCYNVRVLKNAARK